MSLYIKVTKECSLRCPFCYSQVADGAIDLNLLDQTIKDTGTKELVFHGGEPLMYPDKCLEIMNRYPEKKFTITTNFVWPWTEERAEVLKRIRYFATSYSVDRFRGYPAAFKLFKENLKRAAKDAKMITLLVTLSREQLKQPPEELAAIIEGLPVTNVTLERVYDLAGQNLKGLYEDTDQYLMRTFELIPEKKNNLYQWMKDSAKDDVPLYCVDCDNQTIGPEGKLWGCPQMENREIKSSHRRECLECDLFQWCKGDCPGFRDVCSFPKETFRKVLNEYRKKETGEAL